MSSRRTARMLRRMEVLKDGLPRSSFAYMPTPDISTWAVPYRTADGEVDVEKLNGFTGFAESWVPDEAQEMVIDKLRSVFREHYGDEVTYPAALDTNVMPDSSGDSVTADFGADGEMSVDSSDAEGEPDTGIMLDKPALNVQVVFCPCCGEKLVIPEYTGQFDWLTTPLHQMSEAEQLVFLNTVEAQFREVGRRNSVADLSLLQQVHDLTVELGAICSPDEAPVDEGTGDSSEA